MNRPDPKFDFANAVKFQRAKRQLTQEVLAERAGLHRTYISDIERAVRNVSLENIHKLAGAFGISISELFAPLMADLAPESDLTSSHPSAGSVDILLVEDNPDDAELTLRTFKQARFKNRVRVVRDGAEALDYVFCRGQYALRSAAAGPQLILLDLQLPKVNGLEVLRRLQEDKATRTIPVVVLTVSRSAQDWAECLRLGARTCIVKPVNFQNLSLATPQLQLDWALVGPVPALAGTIRPTAKA